MLPVVVEASSSGQQETKIFITPLPSVTFYPMVIQVLQWTTVVILYMYMVHMYIHVLSQSLCAFPECSNV